ncbi:MAG TPA: WD40 repeat domain-containing protein [Ktedonobacteraceae bacterium]
MNNETQPSLPGQDESNLSSQIAKGPQCSFSRRAVLVGLGMLAGVGVVGCAPLPGQGATPTGVIAAPTPTNQTTPTPTPAPAPLGKLFYTYTGHKDRVNAVAWSPDGQRLASGSIDATVQLWDNLTGGNVVTHHNYAGQGATVTWAPEGRHLASTGRKSLSSMDYVELWDAATGKTLITYPAHTNSPVPGPVTGLNWSPDGKYLAAASFDYTVRVWDLTTGTLRFFYSDPHGYLMTCVAWSPDSKFIAFGNDDNGEHNVMVQVWNVASRSQVAVYRKHTKPVQCVAWSPNGKYIASGANDNTARVWHAATGAPLFTYNGHAPSSPDLGSSVISVAWSPDGKRVVSGGVDSTAQIWDGATGQQYFKYRGHQGAVYAAIWSPNGKYIASGGDDKTVQIWQAV